MKAVAGRKTDVAHAQWVARLVESSLVRTAFVPPESVRQLWGCSETARDPTRDAQRLEELLKDVGTRHSSMVSDVFGVSGRAMLEALIADERDTQHPLQLARRCLRSKLSILVEA